VIAEARRTFTYLNLFGYRVDAIIANRLIPDDVSDPYFDRWKEIQATHMATISESFAPLPVLTARLRDQELVGSRLLSGLADEVYGASDPSDVLFTDDPMTVTKKGDGYVLALKLPFTSKEDLEIATKQDELFVKVGPYRRTIMLPAMLSSRRIASAKLVEDRVEVLFEGGGARKPTTGRGTRR
jgi:arsenite-transporting ATPase